MLNVFCVLKSISIIFCVFDYNLKDSMINVLKKDDKYF